MAQRIFAILPSQHDRDCIAASTCSSIVRFCSNRDDLVRAVLECRTRKADDSCAIIVDLDHGRGVNVIDATRVSDGAGTTIPVAVRTNLTAAALREIVDIAGRRSASWVSVENLEPADIVVDDLMHAPEGRTAQLVILDRLTRDLSPSVRGIVETAILLSHRRAGVSKLAIACGLAVRTVEWRLSSADLPPARTILAWMGALHAVWQIDVLGWTHKRVARNAGFATAELCDVSIQRHTGARLLQICRMYGFDNMLDCVRAALLRRNSSCSSRLLFPRADTSEVSRSSRWNDEESIQMGSFVT